MGGGKSTAKAQAAETTRLNQEAETQKAEAEQKRKAKAAQRPQTDVFGTGATGSTTMGGTLGG
jgi:hypothetical protein